MNNHSLIIRSNVFETKHNGAKINTRNTTYHHEKTSHIFSQPSARVPPPKLRKVDQNNIYSLPQIAIKKEDTKSEIVDELQIALVNGSWDTSNKIPNIVAEMHNLNSEEIEILRNSCNQTQIEVLNDCSPRGSDSGIEADCTEGNLSWLLNYKIHELPPVPADTSEPFLETGASSTVNVASSQTNNDYNKFQIHIFNEQNTPEYLPEDSSRGTGHSYRYSGPKKPPFTYTELIEHALGEKGELTVSGIYQWISEHFPFYKQNDDRWKNSVRHNLSINPHFRKGGKAVHGAGHLWTIAQRDDRKSWQIRQRMQQFMQSSFNEVKRQETDALEIELQAATASILEESYEFVPEKNNQISVRNDTKKQIEIELINVSGVPESLDNDFSDFLSPPVSKQQIVQECGLGNDFLITDLNPQTLGLNLAEAEVINGDAIYDDISFEYYDLQKQ